MFGQESISSRFSSSVNSLSAWRVKVGVFVPLEEVEEPSPGEVYQVFSESELRRLEADVPCLKSSERSFGFWENEEDAVYDGL